MIVKLEEVQQSLVQVQQAIERVRLHAQAREQVQRVKLLEEVQQSLEDMVRSLKEAKLSILPNDHDVRQTIKQVRQTIKKVKQALKEARKNIEKADSLKEAQQALKAAKQSLEDAQEELLEQVIQEMQQVEKEAQEEMQEEREEMQKEMQEAREETQESSHQRAYVDFAKYTAAISIVVFTGVYNILDEIDHTIDYTHIVTINCALDAKCVSILTKIGLFFLLVPIICATVLTYRQLPLKDRNQLHQNIESRKYADIMFWCLVVGVVLCLLDIMAVII